MKPYSRGSGCPSLSIITSAVDFARVFGGGGLETVIRAAAPLGQPGDRGSANTLASAGFGLGVVVLGRAAGAEHFEDVGDVIGVAWLWRFICSALGNKRLRDRARVF